MPFHAKKSLGQNFLINKGIIAKVIAAAELSKNDTVLEIGPGMGVLTEELLKYSGRVIAVEKDKRLYELLQEKFKDADNLELINADITDYELQIKNYKIVANIPYNITGQIFNKFLLADDRPQMIIVMVQKEVGDRLLGKEKSILSLVAELYGDRKKVCDVSPGSFRPAPKVSSSVIKLTVGRRVSHSMEKKVLQIAKAGFSQRRKKLISNLSTALKIDKKILQNIFLSLDLHENARAEELSRAMWLKLAEMMKF
ncbi:MAG: 16S rRNA (adenine(1518)-N(6)/adenine(1519)-N(6))-dimethyltransferase RsmA [Patescibacteria group bacterium]